MSVAEFILACTVSIPIVCAGHEIVRLYSIHRSAEVILNAKLSEAALQSLSYIAADTFSSHSRIENKFEFSVRNDIRSALLGPLFQWRWFQAPSSDNDNTLVGIRVSATGPSKDSVLDEFHSTATLCVSSWFEPLLEIVSDNRSCLGEYLKKGSAAGRSLRGISFKIEARRSVPVTVPIYFFGLYSAGESP